MNTGAFGENFPYSNFHDLNMDWIIQIAKDFLDQYTNIQNTIDTGLDNLNTTAENLQNLLQEWYDTHSEDIADQLATALEELNEWYTTHEGYLEQYLTTSIDAFNQAAEQKAAETIASIPADYTTLAQQVTDVQNQLSEIAYTSPNILNPENIMIGKYYKAEIVDGRAEVHALDNPAYACAWIDVERGQSYVVSGISYNAYNGDDDGYAIGIAYTTAGSTPTPVFDTTTVNSAYGNQDKTTTRVYFSWRFATYPVESFMANEGTTLLPFDEYGMALQPEIGVSYEQLTDLPEAIVESRITNLLNPANIITGKYYRVEITDGRGHIVLVDNDAFACGWIDVEVGKSYIATGISFNAFNADDDGYAIGIAYTTGGSTPSPIFDTTAINNSYGNQDKTTTRLYFSWRFASYPTTTYMINEGTTLLPYEEYTGHTRQLANDIVVPVSNLSVKIAPEIYTVDINGTGQYTSFTECLRQLSDNTNPKIIYVKAGTYDIFDELGGSEYANSISGQGYDWFDVSVVVPKNTKIIGIGEVILEFKPTASQIPSDVMSLLSPVNVIYDIYMENITIDCDNCRYGIHDDTGHIEGITGTTHIYKNITIKKLRTNGGINAAFGCGMQKNQYMEFDCCNFTSPNRPFSFHNQGTTGTHIDNTIIVIKDCLSIPASGENALRFGNVNGHQVKIDVRVFNSYLNGKIWIGNESETERPNAYNVMLMKSGNPQIEIESATNIYTPQIYN